MDLSENAIAILSINHGVVSKTLYNTFPTKACSEDQNINKVIVTWMTYSPIL